MKKGDEVFEGDELINEALNVEVYIIFHIKNVFDLLKSRVLYVVVYSSTDFYSVQLSS